MQSNTMKDGFGVTVAFTGHSFTLLMDPTSITPPGVDGGDAINTTTHSNTAVVTKHPRTLKEITDAAMTVAYDPGKIDDILAVINVNCLITFTTPDDGDTPCEVYGYLKSFKPKEFVEGQMPTADCEIVITCDNAGTETGPASS